MIKDGVRHTLVEGGVGEVLPAEMYQEVADFQRSTVDHLELDHAIDWHGMPVHRGIRFPRATALVEITDPEEPMVDPQTRTHFAFGFADGPIVRAGARSVYGRDVFGWWLEWRCIDRGPQSIVVGVRVRNGTDPFEVRWPQDLGEGQGRVLLGMYFRRHLGEDDVREELSDAQRNLLAVTILIR